MAFNRDAFVVGELCNADRKENDLVGPSGECWTVLGRDAESAKMVVNNDKDMYCSECNGTKLTPRLLNALVPRRRHNSRQSLHVHLAPYSYHRW